MKGGGALLPELRAGFNFNIVDDRAAEEQSNHFVPHRPTHDASFFAPQSYHSNKRLVCRSALIILSLVCRVFRIADQVPFQ